MWNRQKKMIRIARNRQESSRIVNDLVLLYGFPWISLVLNTKTAECRATRHEIKNFFYETIDLFKPRRLKYTRGSETPK